MLRKSKFFLIATTLSLLSILGASVVFAAPAPKVDVCHLNDTGAYVKINISENALPAHVEHGDAGPGELVPGVPGKKFADDCSLVDANANVAGSWEGYSGLVNQLDYHFIMTVTQDSGGSVSGNIVYSGKWNGTRTVTGDVSGNEFTFITHNNPTDPTQPYWANCDPCTVSADETYFHGYGKDSSGYDVEFEATKQP